MTVSPGRSHGRTQGLSSRAPGELLALLSVTKALVVENDPTDDVRRLGEWLTDAGLEL